MTKYDDLPMLIQGLKDVSSGKSDKFDEFRLKLLNAEATINEKNERIFELENKIQSNINKSVIVATTAAVGGYIVGK